METTELHADSTLYSSSWAWLVVLESRAVLSAGLAGCLRE